ncbi:MAG TPA: hypothetical protein VMU60_05995 [Syntrophobacteria bacterium]|nr:hypothetical protein [Syntrophobacteria bacterium]
MNCGICQCVVSDNIFVQDGDRIAARLRAYARVIHRPIPPGNFQICQTCLKLATNVSHFMEIEIKKEMKHPSGDWWS